LNILERRLDIDL